MNTYKLLYKNFIVNHKPKICNRYTKKKKESKYKIKDNKSQGKRAKEGEMNKKELQKQRIK